MNLKFICVIIVLRMWETHASTLSNQTNSDATIIIDPWVLTEREAIILALLNGTHIPTLFGEDNRGNILWGFGIQTHWQIISGRQQSNLLAVRIDDTAWFADINYLLTVVPYLVAMKSNLLPPTQFLPPQSNSHYQFPITYETIDPEIAQGWTNYFETIKILRVDPSYISLENLQKLLWKVHNSTVMEALPKFESERQLLNSKEGKFANGFGHFVELLALMNLNTSYPPIYSLNKMFPQRSLRASDIPPFIFDMTLQQNAIISAYFAVDDMTKVPLVWTVFVATIRNGMAIINCAKQIQQTFNDFLAAPGYGIFDLLINVVNNC